MKIYIVVDYNIDNHTYLKITFFANHLPYCQKCGNLYTNIVWSTAQRRDYLHKDKIAPRKKCGHLLHIHTNVVFLAICSMKKMW